MKAFTQRYNYCMKHLGKYIGKGSSRVVFQLDDEKVLKLAFNKKGVAQNYEEYISYGNRIGITPNVFEIDNQKEGYYIVTEFVLPAKKGDFKHCLGVNFEVFCKFMKTSWVNHCANNPSPWLKSQCFDLNTYVDYIENNEDLAAFDDYVANTHVPLENLLRVVNYGMTNRNGVPEIVLLDSGLSQEILTMLYHHS